MSSNKRKPFDPLGTADRAPYASLLLVVADAKVGPDWQGIDNGEDGGLDGSDWSRANDAWQSRMGSER